MAGSWTSICSDEADVLKVAELGRAWQKIQSASRLEDVGRTQLRFWEKLDEHHFRSRLRCELRPGLHEQLRVVSVICQVQPMFLVAANLNDRF